MGGAVAGPLPVVTGRRLLRALEKDGWVATRKGDHLIFTHPMKPGIVPVPNHPSAEVDRGTLRSIINQAGLTADDLRKLL